ncbi:hypothetical protein [Aridibaculum aurantiacum]|uniref:hypothetical protein n=1 Tax=Aridibaculum aurantiacum TaxID=2810307 RepID=UPI001A9703F2|nr:hypothetical protein [Aridibaculum aurantiacum]
MAPQDLKPGTIVKDKAGNINFGLPVQVIAESNAELMVAYVNLDGNYQESWLMKDHALQLEVQGTKLHNLNPALF